MASQVNTLVPFLWVGAPIGLPMEPMFDNLFFVFIMNATPRRIITVTSSFCFNKISTDHRENRVVVRGEALLCPPAPLSTAGFILDRHLKTT
jgi:hypothetical protein